MNHEPDRLQQLVEENKKLHEKVNQLQQSLDQIKQTDDASEARDHLLFLFNNASLGLIEYDQEQRISAFSKGAEKIFGWKAEEVLGKYWYDWQHIHEEDEPAVVGNVKRYIAEKLTYSSSVNRNRRKDGSLIWCEWNDTSLFDDSGNVSRTLSFVRNVTGRVVGEQKLSESEKQFRALFETMLLGVLIHNSQGEITAANPAAEKILGLSKDQMVGRHSTDPRWVSIEEDRTPFPDENQPVMRVLQSGQEVCDVVMGVYNPNESDYRWISISALPLFRSGEDKPYQVYTTFEDITAERKYLQALRDSEERYRALVEAAPFSILVVQDKKYVFANPAAAHYHGLSTAQDLIGKSSFYNVPAAQHAEIEERLQRLFNGQSNQGIEIRIMGLDGVERLIITTSVPIQFKGKPARLIFGQDITERKQLEASILSVEKMASIGTLAAGIAHEINSPLQIITGLSRRLINQLESNNYDSDHMIKDLTSMEQNSWRVARIVRSLLSYSRVSMDEMRKNNLNEIVEDTLVLIEHQLASWSNIRIKTDLQQEIPDMYCERNSLIQVLINLLSNARDAMPGGGLILLRTRNISNRKRFILQVEDSGAGIRDKDIKRIFEPFYTTKGPNEGTGLGLSVVKNIIESHGGTIRVTSNAGKGSMFTILLPEVPPILNQQIPES